MQNLIDTLNPATAGEQHQHLLDARRAAKPPTIFFARAGEIEWLPVATPAAAFKRALRPLLNEREMQAFTGIPIHTFDMSLLPHDGPDRGRSDYFSPQEIAERKEAAIRQLQSMRTGYGNPAYLSELRGQAIQGLAQPIAQVSPAQLERQNRLTGEAVYVEALYYSTEKLNFSTTKMLSLASALETPNLGFVPDSSDFQLLGQFHELAHTFQRMPAKPSPLTTYQEEENADIHGHQSYLGHGGHPATVFTRLAARATFHILNLNTDNTINDYSFYPALLGRDAPWSLQQGITARYDLQFRMAALAAGLKYEPQPDTMQENIRSLLNNKPIRDAKFIGAIHAYDHFIQNPKADEQAPVLLEKVWHGGAKLHRDTLRVAGIAYEALNLFRNGPAAY